MTKSKLNGNKQGLGLYELMTAPIKVYRKALAVAEKNDLEEFCELMGVNKSKEDKK